MNYLKLTSFTLCIIVLALLFSGIFWANVTLKWLAYTFLAICIATEKCTIVTKSNEKTITEFKLNGIGKAIYLIAIVCLCITIVTFNK